MKPATPLPLGLVRNVRDTGRDHARIDDANGVPVAHVDVRHGAHADAESFARYLVHAANAYPKLVEALRNALRSDQYKAIAEIEARALLRELGEAA